MKEEEQIKIFNSNIYT